MMLAGSKLRCQLRPSNPVRSNSTWLDALGMFPDAQTISVYTISPPNVSVSSFTLSASKPCRKDVMGSSHKDGESLALSTMAGNRTMTKFVSPWNKLDALSQEAMKAQERERRARPYENHPEHGA